MDIDTKADFHKKILEQLEVLTADTVRRSSVKNIFFTGVVYGVGFFIGSAILATIVLGVLSPWIGQIDWVRDNYERGESLKEASLQALF